MATFRVCLEDKKTGRHDFYVQATTAQDAADIARDRYDVKEILEILKVVGNWK